MARSFTSDDAKQLIASCHRVEDQIVSFLARQYAMMSEVHQVAFLLISSVAFSETVVNDLCQGVSTFPDTSESIALLTALYNDVTCKPLFQECKQLQLDYQRQIRQNIPVLQVATSSLRWFFANGKNRERASAAFTTLSELLHTYEPAMRRLTESLNRECSVPIQTKLTALEEEPAAYRSALAQCAKLDAHAAKPLPKISTLVSQHQSTLDQYQTACQMGAQQMDAAKADVKSCVDKMLTPLLMKQLRGYEVEVLSQRRSGFRTKALKEAGYETLEDVYCATVANLASVHGISQETALQIKEATREIAENVQKVIKLKISTDERSDEATSLIRALYAYRRCQNLLNAAEEKILQPEQLVCQCLPVLSALKNTLCWFVASDRERESYIQSYRQLTDLWASSYPGDVAGFHAAISGFRPFGDHEAWDDFAQHSIAYFNNLEEIIPGILGNGDILYGLPEELAREIQDQTFFPQGLKVTLRRYQEWGVKYILHQEKVLLGDEMGLGKTVQAIATMVSLRNTGASHFLVVCPASVLPNWCKEIDRKSEFRATKVHGSSRQAAMDEWIESGGVAVTTYETVNILSLPDAFQYDLLVVDEAHYVKNAEARRSKSVRAFAQRARRILFMTGTALENNVEEMISLIQVLQPAIASRVKGISFMSAAPQFREQIAPVYYRRKREDVLSELPEMTEMKEWCDLSLEEEAAYEHALRQKNLSAIRKVSWTCKDLSQSSKARRMQEIIESAQEDGRKVLVFSFYLETIRRIRDFLGDRCTQPINGSVSVEKRQEIIDGFDKMPAGSVLLAQIQAGGTGLNIQSASVVIICEPQLKPSIENQAISRAYRMGQTRKVLVYRLLATNTIDERIDEILEEKQQIFNAFADQSFAAQATKQQESSIDDKTFGKLILEEIDRINAKHGGQPKSGTSDTECGAAGDRGETPSPDQEDNISEGNITEDNSPAAAEETAPAPEPDPFDDSTPGGDMSSPSVMLFPDIDSLLQYLDANVIEYKDNRAKHGCLWIYAEALLSAEQIRVAGKRLMFSKSAKALNGAAGWYIS